MVRSLEIILGGILAVSPAFADGGAPVKAPNVPKVPDEVKVLGKAMELYGQGLKAYETGTETGKKVGTVFLDEAEKLIIDNQAEGPSIDLILAEIYTLRDRPSTKEHPKSDHALAISRWERFLPHAKKPDEYKDKILKCRYTVAKGDIASGFILSQYRIDPKKSKLAEELFEVQDAGEALSLAAKFYNRAISQLEILANGWPHNAEILHMLSDAYFRLERFDNALEALRKYIQLKPDDKEAYNSLITTYMVRNELPFVLNESVLIGIKPEIARKNIALALADRMDYARKNNSHPNFQIRSEEEAYKVSELLYEVASARWEREKKKEFLKRDCFGPIMEIFMAGCTEYGVHFKNNLLLSRNREQIAKEDYESSAKKIGEQGKLTVKRMADRYDAIRKDMNDEILPVEEVFKKLVVNGGSLALPQEIIEGVYDTLKNKK
ncbi:MAG TPA: tetratricopeptide repeat protein [Candidatus Nanoarchaeia archaeon]|nr:tetratricopeptide repeat protein [Candidatus Nanoarchaeia archaeon]